jgi:beta-galactosidase
MRCLLLIPVVLALLANVVAKPITYEHVRGTPYKVSYDHRAITINDERTLLISGVIHYPRSTPGMWPYLFKMAKNQGLNTVQTYVFWNIHEQKQGVLDFSGRANLSKFLQDAADAGLFVNLRLGPYVCAEWNYGGLPVWLNQVPNISFRSSNPAWEAAMKKFILEIMDYVTPYLAKNGGPIILAQIENEYGGNDQAYVDWCGSLVTNELASSQIPWIMCNGRSANSTIETCNSCNCYGDGWMGRHVQNSPNTPMLFTENEGWFQQWGDAFAIRTPTDLALSVVQWFAAGGAYHAYYMWHGGNNYGRTAGSGITTMYADDVCLHADGTANEPKYTHLSRLQHILADHAQALVGQDPNRTALPWWDGTKWVIGTQQYVYSYPPSLFFVGSDASVPVSILFRNKNITLPSQSVRIYDDNANLLWDYTNYSDINSANTEILPVVIGPLEWQTWSEPSVSDLPIITDPNPIEQLKITNDETAYLWYSRNVTLTQTQSHTIVQVETRRANALLFFLDGEYLGEFDNHDHSQGYITATVSLDLSTFKPNQQYLFQILSVSLGIDNGVGAGSFEYKGLIGKVWIDDQLLINDTTNPWKHQKGLVGEYLQIYTEDGSSKVNWNTQWTKGIDKAVTWFQAKFDLDHLIKEDTNANPVLLDAQGLNRGHAFINGNDLGIYWLIQGFCHDSTPCCCQQAQINCMEPTQRYYHIPSDWLMPKDNLITIFDELGAHSPGSVGLVQRVVIA